MSPGPPEHRSVSQWSSFVKCGEQFRLEKAEKAPQAPAAWLAQGVAFHSAAEKWELGIRQDHPDEITETYLSEYDRLISEFREKEPDLSKWLTGGRTRPDTDISNRRERGAAQVQTYMEYALKSPERPWEWFDGVAVEVEFELDLDGVRVVGYIDQILIWPDGQVTVRDLKTGSKQPDWPFQLGVYALAVEDITGYLPRWGDFWMAKYAGPLEPVDLSRFTREKVTRWFKQADAAIRQGIYLPNPGDNCRTCPVTQFCSVFGSRANEYPFDLKEV